MEKRGILNSNLYNFHRFVLLDQSPLLLKNQPITETLRSTNNLTMEFLLEYFDKRLETVTHNMERIISDVNTMRQQIDQLIPDNILLKRHMADIQKINKNEHDNNNDDSDFTFPQRRR
jgi:hypothetical protein